MAVERPLSFCTWSAIEIAEQGALRRQIIDPTTAVASKTNDAKIMMFIVLSPIAVEKTAPSNVVELAQTGR